MVPTQERVHAETTKTISSKEFVISILHDDLHLHLFSMNDDENTWCNGEENSFIEICQCNVCPRTFYVVKVSVVKNA